MDRRVGRSLSVVVCWVVVVGVWLVTETAQAQDTNYQNYLMGQGAVGMGGAFTAIANDPSAAWYNPAGFAAGRGLQVGIGLTLYGLEYRQLENGLFRPEGKVDLDGLEFVVFPSTAGVAARFGPRDKTNKPVWGAGFSILSPDRTQIRFGSSFEEFVGTSRRQASFVLHRDDQVFMAGPTLARRFGPISIGVGVYYVHRAFSWVLNESDTLSSCQASRLQTCVLDSSNSATSSVAGFVGQLNVRVGLLARLSKQWNLGLAASFSSIRLWSDGSFFLQRFLVPRDPKQTPTNNFVRRPGGLQVNSPLPWEVRAGLAWQANERLLLSLDLIFYAPMSYVLVDLPEEADLFQYPRKIQRNLVFNVNFGGEYWISPLVPFRWGLFTNLSSAPDVPEISNAPMLPKVHMFGATTSIGLRLWRISFDLGVSVSYGVGSGQRFRPGSVVSFERVFMRQFFAHFYLAGATEMLGRSLQELWKTVQRSPLLRSSASESKPPSRRAASQKKPKQDNEQDSQQGSPNASRKPAKRR